MRVFEYDFFTDQSQAINSVGIVDYAFQSLKHGYGVFQRVPTVDHPKSNNGWIRLVSANQFACGNWETCQGAFFSDVKLTNTEKQRLIKATDKSLQKELRKMEAKYKATAERALAFWKLCNPIDLLNIHPYFRRKQVRPTATIRESTAQRFKEHFGYSLKAETGRLLVIPLVSQNGLSSLQLITEDGNKSFLSGGRTGGCYWQSHKSENPEYVAIGEGIATVLSYIQHRPEKMLGVSAMNAGNLPKVAEVIREKYPNAIIILLGDNDKNGVGQRFAKQAQDEINGKSAIQIPIFSDNDKKLFKLIAHVDKEPTDWNDFYLIQESIKKFNLEVYK